MNNKHFLGKRVSSFEVYDTVGPITGVALLIDDNNEIVAGTDDGYVMEIECPYGTQAMANNLLSSLQGKSYHGYRSEAAELVPEAELGDGITVNNLYSMLAYRSVDFGGGHLSEIAAPGESELEHEYPYKSQAERQIERKIATTRSMITKTAEEIRLEVSNELDSLSSNIDVKLDSITSTVQGIDGRVSTVEQTASGLTTSVQGLNNQVSTLQQTASGLTSTVQGINGEISTINQTLQGVAFTSSLANGTTTINGGCIKTGTVSADFIKLGGWMDIYDSIDSNTVIGRFGKTSLTVSGESKDALGFISTSNLTIGSTGVCAIASNGTMYINADWNIEFGTSNCDVNFHTDTVKFRGVTIWYVNSDERLKQDIDYNVSDKLCTAFDALRPVTFRYKKEKLRGQNHVGFIAQDVLGAIENAGLGNALTDVDCDGYYALNYGEMVALLTAKIKQLEKRLEALS